jgi:hypothetical protein
MSYGVRDARGEVFFEEARLVLDLPAVLPEGAGSFQEPARIGGPGPEAAETPEADTARPESGGPFLPALLLTFAACLVFGGLAVWMRSARAKRRA